MRCIPSCSPLSGRHLRWGWSYSGRFLSLLWFAHHLQSRSIQPIDESNPLIGDAGTRWRVQGWRNKRLLRVVIRHQSFILVEYAICTTIAHQLFSIWLREARISILRGFLYILCENQRIVNEMIEQITYISANSSRMGWIWSAIKNTKGFGGLGARNCEGEARYSALSSLFFNFRVNPTIKWRDRQDRANQDGFFHQIFHIKLYDHQKNLFCINWRNTRYPGSLLRFSGRIEFILWKNRQFLIFYLLFFYFGQH